MLPVCLEPLTAMVEGIKRVLKGLTRGRPSFPLEVTPHSKI